MFRYCLLGSLAFHVIILLGVGFCLPRYTTPGPSERYFQVEALLDHVNKTEIRAEPSPNNLRLKPKSRKVSEPKPFLPANNIGSRNDSVSIEPSIKVTAAATGESSFNSIVESDLEQESNPAGVFIGSSPVSPGEVEGKNNQAAKPEGDFLSSLLGTKPSLPVVDLPPQKIYSPSPEYPWKAKWNNWEGTVHLRAEVLANGKIGEVLIINSSGYKILDQAARDAIRTWRFKPALKNGLPVICYKEIPVRFQLEE
ncbi:MAG: energy transducer TonB [Bacteroidota bacterium]